MGKQSPFLGKSLNELLSIAPGEVIATAILRGHTRISPFPDIVLKENDALLLEGVRAAGPDRLPGQPFRASRSGEPSGLAEIAAISPLGLVSPSPSAPTWPGAVRSSGSNTPFGTTARSFSPSDVGKENAGCGPRRSRSGFPPLPAYPVRGRAPEKGDLYPAGRFSRFLEAEVHLASRPPASKHPGRWCRRQQHGAIVKVETWWSFAGVSARRRKC